MEDGVSVILLGLNRAQHHWLDQGLSGPNWTVSSGQTVEFRLTGINKEPQFRWRLYCWTGPGWTRSRQHWIMGCSASVVLLLRSVGGADCGHMCSRQDQMSLDAATPTLEGYTTTTSPLTIIVMVTRATAPPPPNACVGR